MRILTLIFLLLASLTISAQDQLYKVSLLRAKPGALLPLIDQINEDIANYSSYLQDKPYQLRHSQGDHWDLMVIYPIQALSAYFEESAVNKRGLSKTLDKPYGNEFYDLVAFQEEAIVTGPDLEAFQKNFEQYALFHIEIFTSLAGKQAELLAQRQAENVFYAGIDHRPNMIFTRVFGPSWDNFTIGFYTDLHDFAGPAVSFEQEDRAAKEAGFECVNFIGSYLRSLIAEHHDTLAWKVSD